MPQPMRGAAREAHQARRPRHGATHAGTVTEPNADTDARRAETAGDAEQRAPPASDAPRAGR
ncbi:hypothetical protein D2W49_20775, partial [Burkholderia pseudomallei]